MLHTGAAKGGWLAGWIACSALLCLLACLLDDAGAGSVPFGVRDPMGLGLFLAGLAGGRGGGRGSGGSGGGSTVGRGGDVV